MDDNREKTRTFKATDSLYDDLKWIAHMEHRTLKAQVQYFLEKSVSDYKKEHSETESINSPLQMTIKDLRKTMTTPGKELTHISKTLLVVDDSPFERMLYLDMLKNLSCTIHSANDADEAIEVYKELGPKNIDVVLIDYNLPGEDKKGDYLYKELLKINPEMKAVIMTSDMRKIVESYFTVIDPPPIGFHRKSISKIADLVALLA